MNQGCPDLSIVIPARQEAARLPQTLLRLQEFLPTTGWKVEIIPVVQGDDKTADHLRLAAALDPQIRPIIDVAGNGKGRAVRLGVQGSRGKIILFIDADLSVPPECLGSLVETLENSPECDVLIGSRHLPESRITRPQPFLRQLSGRAFNLALRCSGLTRFHDTQCGCKLFRHDAAKAIFARTTLDGFAFDVEILQLAEQLGYQVTEMPVEWADSGGSRVWLPRDGLKALCDAWSLRQSKVS